MKVTEELLTIISRASERGLRIGQLFANIDSILRFVGKDLFYIDDDTLLMVATRLVNGDNIKDWQAAQLRDDIDKLRAEIATLREQRALAEDSARELADYLRVLDSTGGTVSNPPVKVTSIL